MSVLFAFRGLVKPPFCVLCQPSGLFSPRGNPPPSSVCYSWDSRYTLGREELASILAYFLDSFPEALSSLWRVRRGIRIPILLYRSVFYLLNYPPLRC